MIPPESNKGSNTNEENKKKMPFKSEKQRKYLGKNHPEIAQRWENLYKSPTRLLKGFLQSPKLKKQEVKEIARSEKAIVDEKILGKKLPENIEKLVDFMKETGGTIEDYTRLNADYSYCR